MADYVTITGRQIRERTLELRHLPVAPGDSYLLISGQDGAFAMRRLVLSLTGSLIIDDNGSIITQD